MFIKKIAASFFALALLSSSAMPVMAESSEPYNAIPGTSATDSETYDAINWAYSNGIVKGTSNTVFSRYSAITRAQAVTMIWRFHGCPKPSKTYKFADVSSNKYYSEALSWAAEKGIVTWKKNLKFRPDDECLRKDAVTFLWRYNGRPDPLKDYGFYDVVPGSYYAQAVNWAEEHNYVSDLMRDCYEFWSDDVMCRGQFILMLYRFNQDLHKN